MQLRQGGADRLDRQRAGAERVLVGAQLAQAGIGETTPKRDDVQARVVGAQRTDGGLRQRLEVGTRPAQSSATG
jgi:hypothetical protein